MITTLKDDIGRIIAYCEWRLVGQSGYDKEDGEYVWINDIWVHQDFERTKRINRIIDEIMRIAPSAKWGYFVRGKYGFRKKMFSREQFERRRNTYDALVKEN
jgi:hypothetical protein